MIGGILHFELFFFFFGGGGGIFGGAYIQRGLFSEFYGIATYTFPGCQSTTADPSSISIRFP